MTVNRNYEFGEGYSLEDDAEFDSDIQAVDAGIFGEMRGKDGRIVAKPLRITDIWPDMRQPRRAIPLRARGQWNGYPQDVPAVLADWHELAEQDAGEVIDLVALLRSSGEGVEVDPEASPVVAEYLELVALAASIRNRGLTNAITVTKQGQRYVIETGERRWLAFHLLTLWTDGDYGKIPAVVKDKADVWRQAEENAARRPLNAIGIARQLALLIMDMYPTEDFGAFDQVVLPGECDRKYYAQVANGQAWPVTRGLGQAVLNATGLKSTAQVSHYRRLLSIDDDLWLLADMENWTEGRIREAIQAPNRPAKTDDGFTTVNPHAPKTGDNGPNRGEMTDFGSMGFSPFQTVGRGHLGNQPPTLPTLRVGYEEAGASSASLGEGSDVQKRVPTEYYPPTPDDAEQEEIFVFEDLVAAEDRQPVVTGHTSAVAFLEMIGQLNEVTARNPQVAAAVAALLQFSPESIRQIVTAYGGRETYEAEIDRYTQLLWQFLGDRLDEVTVVLETLRAMGRDYDA